MKRLMVAFAVISVSGCLCAKECKTNDDCASGQICGSQNLCESTGGGSAGGTTAGGTAGGRAGGTGGGSSGGMSGGDAGSMGGGDAGGAPMAGGSAMAGGAGGGPTGGGMTAGGTAGGSMCPCAELQECVAGLCVNASLQVSFPMEGMQHPAGAPLGVSATLTTVDGGPWPGLVAIPYTAGWGGSGLLPSDGGLVLVAVPANPTQGSIVIGWTDGGPGPVTRNVVFLRCSPSVVATCEPFERCAPDMNAGVCKPFQVVLSWTDPMAGAVKGPLAPNVRLSLTVAVDGGPMPASVPIRFDGGVVATATQMGTSSTYTAPDLAFSSALAPMDGVQTLTAGWPTSGPSENRDFRWDSTPPVVTVRVQSAPPRPMTWPNGTTWRKDEVAQVEVRSTEPAGAPATLEVVGATGAVTLVGLDAGCSLSGTCPEARCDCFEVDFAQVALSGVTGSVGFRASVQDVALNAASIDGGVQVTRVKWQNQVPGLSGPVDPALDTLGNVYVGGASTTTTGVVAQVLRDGGLGWSQAYGAVTAPVVWSPLASQGDAGVFVATRTGTLAQIRALDSANGGIADPGLCVTGLSGALYSARMVSLGATVVTARESGASQQQAYIADPVSANCNSNGTVFSTGKASLVGRGLGGGATEVYAASAGIGGFFRLTTNTTGTNWSGTTDGLAGVLSPVGGVSLGGGRAMLSQAAANVNGVLSHNLLISSGAVSAAFLGGASVNWTGATLGPSTPTTIDAYFASPAGTTAAEFFKTTLTLSNNTFSPNTQAAASRGFLSPTNNGFSPAHAPVLGQGGLAYIVSTAGELSVFSTTGVRQWNAPVSDTLFGNVSVAPVLDVARTAAGAPACGKPGILYVLSNTGNVTALIVDSRGLEGAAAWPRFQHDNANSGNADTALSAWSCP